MGPSGLAILRLLSDSSICVEYKNPSRPLSLKSWAWAVELYIFIKFTAQKSLPNLFVCPYTKLILERHSPYHFLDKPIRAETLHTLFEAARHAASGYNEQPWRFIYATRRHHRRISAFWIAWWREIGLGRSRPLC